MALELEGTKSICLLKKLLKTLATLPTVYTRKNAE